jgi:hypothetical protein
MGVAIGGVEAWLQAASSDSKAKARETRFISVSR